MQCSGIARRSFSRASSRVEPIPDLAHYRRAALFGTLQNIETLAEHAFELQLFQTKDMREEFQRAQLKGVLPVIFVFMARTGKEIGVGGIHLPGQGKASPPGYNKAQLAGRKSIS